MRVDGLRARMLDLEERMIRSLMGGAPPEGWLDVELTMPQLKILLQLTHGEAASVGDLARAIGVTAPTASGILERLVRAGLVSREEDAADRRITLIRPTERGAAIVQRLFTARRQQLAELSAGFTRDELRTLVAALELLVASAERRAARRPRRRRSATG